VCVCAWRWSAVGAHSSSQHPISDVSGRHSILCAICSGYLRVFYLRFSSMFFFLSPVAGDLGISSTIYTLPVASVLGFLVLSDSFSVSTILVYTLFVVVADFVLRFSFSGWFLAVG